MPAPKTAIDLWYDFALQQIAAECYLDGIDLQNPEEVIRRLKLGSNNFAPIVYVNGVAQPNELLETYSGGPDTAILPGATRMTASQTRYFLENWRIVHQSANDPSGFSGTLLQNLTTGEYTLSFRSTEFQNQSRGGDFERDVGVAVGVTPGADSQITLDGFAFGQLAGMERYYRFLREGGVDRDGTVRGPLLPENENIYVTGYSLGGRLAA
jgi:hypothetical protein